MRLYAIPDFIAHCCTKQPIFNFMWPDNHDTWAIQIQLSSSTSWSHLNFIDFVVHIDHRSASCFLRIVFVRLNVRCHRWSHEVDKYTMALRTVRWTHKFNTKMHLRMVKLTPDGHTIKEIFKFEYDRKSIGHEDNTKETRIWPMVLVRQHDYVMPPQCRHVAIVLYSPKSQTNVIEKKLTRQLIFNYISLTFRTTYYSTMKLRWDHGIGEDSRIWVAHAFHMHVS